MEIKIVTDSREQNKLFSDCIKGLKTGDYSIEGYEDTFAIERKSLMDLFGTLGKGHDRFKKELERAKELDYFAILVVGTYTQMKSKKFPGAYHSGMKGFVIAQSLFTIHIKYGIPIFFAQDEKEGRELIKELSKAYVKWKLNQVPSCHEGLQ
jgi:DNA excision repair protein ERCC-4